MHGSHTPCFEGEGNNYNYADQINILQFSPKKSRPHDLEILVEHKMTNGIKKAMIIILEKLDDILFDQNLSMALQIQQTDIRTWVD